MQIGYAFLCSYAGYLNGRRFVIVGPDVDMIAVPRFPTDPVSLHLAAKLLLSPEEPTENHSYRIELTNEQGKRTTVSGDEPISARRNVVHQDQPAKCNIFTRVPCALEAPGEYQVHLVVDGRDMVSIPLSVTQSDTAEVHRPYQDIDAEIELRRSPYSKEFERIEAMTPSLEDIDLLAITPPREWLDEDKWSS